jgi:hypothetical protein
MAMRRGWQWLGVSRFWGIFKVFLGVCGPFRAFWWFNGGDLMGNGAFKTRKSMFLGFLCLEIAVFVVKMPGNRYFHE